ncbi:MAG: dethiobiotin synthase [Muribaculaceae bacterium]|nr:dethiobiotin synthase [Muribaculaceae bacterium]
MREENLSHWISQQHGPIFVSGIDTDAGKSYATGSLAEEMNKAGNNTITMKFIQTGNIGFSEDIEVHRSLMSGDYSAYDKKGITAPVIFSYPCSPELAARIDGQDIDFNKIDTSIRILCSDFNTVLIEGAGGLMVPLKEDYLTIDYIRDKNLPLIFVTNGRLGSISQTLLGFYAIKNMGIELSAVIYNSYFDSDKIIADDSRNFIEKWVQKHFPNACFIEMGTL